MARNSWYIGPALCMGWEYGQLYGRHNGHTVPLGGPCATVLAARVVYSDLGPLLNLRYYRAAAEESEASGSGFEEGHQLSASVCLRVWSV